MLRRPLLLITLAFTIGIIIQNHIRISLYLIVIAFLLTFISLILASKIKTFSLFICVMFLGALVLECNDNFHGTMTIFANKEVKVLGNIIKKSMIKNNEYYLYSNKVIYDNKNYNLNEKVLLKVYDYNDTQYEIDGKNVLIKGKLIIPDKARNPNTFDYNMYLKSQGIYTVLYTDFNKIKILGEGEIPFFIKIRHSIKRLIYEKALNILPSDEGKIALSIVFGDKDILDKDIYDDFKTIGIAHVLAVSGLHFGILYLFVNSILLKTRISHFYRVFATAVIIWTFALLVGFSPSVIRASSMITIYIFGNMLDRKYDLFSSLSTIGLATLIVNPFLIFNIGFQLSFAAVMSIGLFYEPISKKLSFIQNLLNKIISSSLAAQIGIIPILAYHFNIFSPISLVLNIPVIFLVGYILPISLLFFISLLINTYLSFLIGHMNKLLIQLLMIISELGSHIPYGSFNVISPRISFIIFYYTFFTILFYKGKIKFFRSFSRKVLLMCLVIIFSFIFIFENTYSEKLSITFIDCGQGDCTIIKTPKNNTILIDGGRSKDNIFLPRVLLKNGISKIDMIILSHIHSDHIGGVIDVLNVLKVNQILIGTDNFISEEWVKLKELCFLKNIPIIKTYRGYKYRLEDNLTLEILNPPLNILKGTNDDINNNSMACILDYKDIEILFTGDIENEAEMEIIESVQRRDVDILKVSHHGSKTSTNPKFIKFFSPEIAVIQVGKNVFGHPHRDVINILKDMNIKVYRNDIDGAVIINTDGKNIKVSTAIQNHY